MKDTVSSQLLCAYDIHPSDIDECEENTDDCHINATCNNNDGSFSCECMTGLSGDGTTCQGMRLILKIQHYIPWNFGDFVML